MPLDPFFAERLRTHRRYLLRQALGAAQRRLGTLWARSAPTAPAAPPEHDARPDSAPPRAKTPAASPQAVARAKHRRAALAWDRKEQADVGTPGPLLRTSEHLVPVAGYPDVRVRIYHPDASAGPPPVCLAFFGGAFRIGGIDYPTTDAANRRRAAASGVAIAAVDYALAPEHRYPTQVEQAYAALEWVVTHGAEVGVDPSRLAVQGTSAGGCVAAALTLVNRDRAAHPLRLQILEVPALDLTGRRIDLRPTWTMGTPAFLVRRELRSVQRTYLGDVSLARQAYASPLRVVSSAEGARGLPPAIILTAEYDPLRRHGADYAAALRRGGVQASAVRYHGAIHDLPLFTGVLAAARRWEAEVVCALRTLHV